jgi:phosphoribulokinase
VHSEPEAVEHNKHFGLTDLTPGVFTPWEDIEAGSDLLFYEGLHGMVKDEAKGVDVSKHVDLGIGVVPVVNLEWIQKIHRDKAERGYSAEATVDTIMRRMPDYIKYITPQFTHTDINFQRVATVDTSNPFIARDIPTPDESFVVIRFRNPKGVDFPYYLSMIPNSFMSRANTMVVPGGKMSHAMEIILSPIMHDMIQKKKK